jgi:hypothetical protein
MDILSNTVALSRMQFALTAIFHMLWPVLTTGMGVYLVIIEGMWLKTRNPDYYHHARFWCKLYLLNFGIGVASGIPMEFQFGTNWAPFSEAVGEFFGSILGFEASMAFMLEAGFLGIMLFGWERVNPIVHYFATIMVAFGANLSTVWILVANSWLQTPVGGEMVNGKFIVSDYFQAIMNPFALNSILHMFFATLETSLFVIGGISATHSRATSCRSTTIRDIMHALEHFLPQAWFVILGIFLLLYVMLDGFDLGVGILSLAADDEERRGILMASLGNVWDANETWLVLMGGALFGAFPLAYGTILTALYIPICMMVFGLIFRAVAFEFRQHSNRKTFWNYAFGAGSFLAALAQGFALGAVLGGIAVDEAGHFVGTTWDWLDGRSILVALTLIQGYILIGSTYLIMKTEGELQINHYRTAKIAAVTTLIGAILIIPILQSYAIVAKADKM